MHLFHQRCCKKHLRCKQSGPHHLKRGTLAQYTSPPLRSFGALCIVQVHPSSLRVQLTTLFLYTVGVRPTVLLAIHPRLYIFFFVFFASKMHPRSASLMHCGGWDRSKMHMRYTPGCTSSFLCSLHQRCKEHKKEEMKWWCMHLSFLHLLHLVQSNTWSHPSLHARCTEGAKVQANAIHRRCKEDAKNGACVYNRRCISKIRSQVKVPSFATRDERCGARRTVFFAPQVHPRMGPKRDERRMGPKNRFKCPNVSLRWSHPPTRFTFLFLCIFFITSKMQKHYSTQQRGLGSFETLAIASSTHPHVSLIFTSLMHPRFPPMHFRTGERECSDVHQGEPGVIYTAGTKKRLGVNAKGVE